MNRLIGVLAALLLAPPLGAASPDLVLVDTAGRPVAHARVSVVGRAYSTPTSAEGLFRLDPLPPLPFELAVADETGAWLGILRVETLEGAPPHRLTLPPAARAEVTVAAGLAPATLAPPAAAPTVVSRAEMDERSPARLADALQDIPGTGRLEEGQSVVPTLRGMARSRVLLLVDDARVTAERRAGTSATYLDPFVLENVEVVRGPGSVAYGSDALGGVVHARTRLPEPGAPIGGRFAFSGEAGGTRALTGGVEGSFPLGGGALLVSVHQRAFRDYEAPSGTIDNSAARDRGILLHAVVPAGAVRLLAGVQLDEGADIGKPATDSNLTRASYPKESSNRFTLGADLGPLAGFSSIEARAYLGRYHLVTDRDRLQTAAQPRKLSEADVSANDASLRVLATRPLLAGNLRVGFDVNGRYGLNAMNTYTDFDATGAFLKVTGEVAVEFASRTDLALFAETEQALVTDLLSLSVGLRGDSVKTRNEGGWFGDRSTSNRAFSGFAAASVVPFAGASVTLQYAHGFRDPLLSDRYFRGVSGRGFVVGNPDLAPESSDQWDLALRCAAGPVRLAAYGYLYRISDLIERYKAGDDFRFRNRGLEEVEGFELEALADLGHGLSARLGAAVVRGEIVDDGSPAGDIPQDSLSLGLDWKATQALWTRLRALAAASKDDFGPAEKARASYFVLDFAAGWRFAPGIEARLMLRNVFDEEYTATADELGVAAPGRSATLVLAGSF